MTDEISINEAIGELNRISRASKAFRKAEEVARFLQDLEKTKIELQTRISALTNDCDAIILTRNDTIDELESAKAQLVLTNQNLDQVRKDAEKDVSKILADAEVEANNIKLIAIAEVSGLETQKEKLQKQNKDLLHEQELLLEQIDELKEEIKITKQSILDRFQ